jgi:hypothetical protein
MQIPPVALVTGREAALQGRLLHFCGPIETVEGPDSISVGANPCLEHFHFYSVQARVEKCGFSWGKAAPGLVTLYTPEVKML